MQGAWRKPFVKKKEKRNASLWPIKDIDKPRKLPPVPSEFSFKLPEESWWLPTQPPMDVSAEQPGLGSSPPGPQLQLHPLPLSRFSLSLPPSLSPFLPPVLSFLLVSSRLSLSPCVLLPSFSQHRLSSAGMIFFVFFGGARRSERGSRRSKVTEVGMKERKRGAEGGRDIDKGQRTKEKCTVQNKRKQKIIFRV